MQSHTVTQLTASGSKLILGMGIASPKLVGGGGSNHQKYRTITS
jgi:hypothetical protein